MSLISALRSLGHPDFFEIQDPFSKQADKQKRRKKPQNFQFPCPQKQVLACLEVKVKLVRISSLCPPTISKPFYDQFHVGPHAEHLISQVTDGEHFSPHRPP